MSQTYNATWMWLYVAALVAMVIFQAVVYMRRGWQRALNLGLTPSQVKRGLVTGVTISILPSLPELIVILALIPLLGTPLPWLRISVVGSAAYESISASIGMQCIGEELVLNGFTVNGWVAAAWVMTVASACSVLWSMLSIKPISAAYERAGKKDLGLVLAIGAGCMIGVLGYVTVDQGLGAMSTKGVAFLISFAIGALLVLIEKHGKVKWLSECIMPISMVLTLVIACFIFK